MTINEQYLKTAIKSAKGSGKNFKRHFGNAGKVKIKNDNPRNLVTKIDLQIEKLIRKQILHTFPEAKIIGEEFGGAKVKADDVVWLIDPIDGTTNFIRGIPICCICIGVWDKKGPLVGVVYNPVIDQIYTAVRGKGAFLNGKKITISKTTRLTEASGAIGWLSPANAKKIFNRIINVTRKLRVLASSAWQVCLVASGQLDYYATPDVNIWDIGAASCILQEAGGKFSDFKNKKLDINLSEILASNGKIHTQLLKITAKI